MTRLLWRCALILAVGAGAYYWLGWGGALAVVAVVIMYVLLTPPPRYRIFGPDQVKEWIDNGAGHFGGFYRDEPVGSPPKKIQRNDPCPCGSGLKYKRCHGPQNIGGS